MFSHDHQYFGLCLVYLHFNKLEYVKVKLNAPITMSQIINSDDFMKGTGFQSKGITSVAAIALKPVSTKSIVLHDQTQNKPHYLNIQRYV